MSVPVRLSTKEEVLMDQLTEREQLFVIEYVNCLDAYEAGDRAGFSKRDIPKIVSQPGVRAAMKRFLGNEIMPLTEVFARLSRIARADMRHFLTFVNERDEHGEVMYNPDTGEPVKSWYLDLEKAARDGQTWLIRELGHTREGPKIKLHDSMQALKELADVHGARDGIRKAGDDQAWSNFFEEDLQLIEDAQFQDVNGTEETDPMGAPGSGSSLPAPRDD